MKSYRYALWVLLILLFGCTEDENILPEPTNEFNTVASATNKGITVKLMAKEDPFVGFNQMTALLTDAEGIPLSGSVKVTPMMTMMTMQHSSPIEFPEGQSLTNGEVLFNTVLVMPSGEMGSWSLIFEVNAKEIEVPLEVVQPEYSRLVSFVSQMDETTKYFIAMVDPHDPKVGQNDLELAIYQRMGMMEWPPVEDLTLELEPWMPSMDHGSPNNLAPVHQRAGHYMGRVNFTMTGDWQIRLKVMLDGDLCGEPYFDLFFQ